ncbi:hypothetical protein ACHAXT_010968 [Thalassiosira profunda]
MLVAAISHVPTAGDAVPVIAAAFAALWTLRLALRCLLSGRQPTSANPEKGEASEAPEVADNVVDPAPSYLASSADDAAIIGGDPSCLPPLRGPQCHALVFRAYTPPNVAGEIPKVDLYGAVNFVRTGRVRTYVPKGARRLLRVDVRGRTVGVHAPKVAKKRRNRRAAGRKERRSGEAAAETNGGQRAGGIQISARRLSFHPEDLNEADDGLEEDMVENEADWDPRNYEDTPALLLDLDELISVSAVSPRSGGVVEIASRSKAASPRKKPTAREDGGMDEARRGKIDKGAGLVKGSSKKGKSGSVRQQKKAPKLEELNEERLCPKKTETNKGSGPDYVAKSLDERDGTGDTSPVGHGQQRNEFAFSTPRDAAEFQRVLMALRVAGREIAWIYEALETLQPSLPPSDKTNLDGDARDVFASPGVRLDDAWGSLREMPILRRGLDRVGHLVRVEEQKRATGGILHDGTGEAPTPLLLGIVDFFSLFLPPLPENGPAILPGMSPCARPGSLIRGRNGATGIEWHHERLGFVLALTRLVSRAALYVRTYVSTKNIVRDGWTLGESGSANQANELNSAGSEDMSSSNADDQTPKVGIDDAAPKPAAVLESGDMPSLPTGVLPQGYTCVGWHVLQIPSLDSEAESSGGSSWSPDTDPLEHVPGLRAVMEKYPYAHFFVFSHLNEPRTAVAYFLLVRSLPVGVDRAFDRAMKKLVCGSAKDRDQRLGISLQLYAGDGLSVATVAFRLDFIGTDAGASSPFLQSNNSDATTTAMRSTDELYGDKIDTIFELLEDVAVPLRKRNQSRGEHNPDNLGEIITMGRIDVTRSDVERYLIASECDIKATVTRIVESAAWRSDVFPVDTRLYTIELQSNQFFQHGRDREGNPIFCFRNMLLGPPRGRNCASVLAVLHRLETYFALADKQHPGTKITVVVFMDAVESYGKEGQPLSRSDPRIDRFEEYYPHSNLLQMQLLNDLIARHYPGRIAKTLVVSSKGWKNARFLRSLFQKAIVLSSVDQVRKYVAKDSVERWRRQP